MLVERLLRQVVSKKMVMVYISLLSALPFPLVLLYSRLYIQEAVSSIIFLQSSTAFGAFVIQAGLRAGLRKEYVQGRKNIVDRVSKTFFLVSFFAALILSPVSQALPTEFAFLPVLAVLNAVLTLLVGQFMLKRDFFRGALSVLCIASINLLAGFSRLLLPMALGNMLIEIASILVLFFYGAWYFGGVKRASLSCLGLVLKKYLGLQVTSFVIYAVIFILALSIVQSGERVLILLYADVTLTANVLLLFVARSSVVFERDILSNGRASRFLLVLHILFFVFSIVFGVARGGENVVLACGVMLAFLGQFTFSSLSQYVEEKYRKLFLLLGFSVLALYLSFFLGILPINFNCLLSFSLYSASIVVFLYLWYVGFSRGFIRAD